MTLHKMVDGVQVECSKEEEEEIRARWASADKEEEIDLTVNGYKYLRQKEYLPVSDQLDMLWHAMDNGEIPKADLFYSSIAAIKEKYKKPT
jgi:hypothetical protein